MPRTSRKRSEIGFYHVILRGNGKQNLFETDKDRAAFMEAARSSFSRDSVTLIAWCLMDNHVHLIIDDPLDRISTAIQRVPRRMQCTSTAHSDTQATCSKGATEAFPLLMTSSCLQR